MLEASPKSLRMRLLGCCAGLALLTGCATSPTPSSQATSQPLQGPQDAAYWTAQYQNDPTNPQVAVRLAEELRATRQYEDALGVLMRASVEHPQNGAVFGEMGKILVETGDYKEALSFLSSAAQYSEGDWRVYSAAGVAYDQLGSFNEAQNSYEQALIYSPNNPTVLSNLGLSYAMAGDLVRAENMLREAYSQRNASEKVQLNLALVVGLQGRFDEAEDIARGSLPDAVARENVAHLRELLSQPSRWKDMKALDGEVTRTQSQAKGAPQPLDAALTVDQRKVTQADESTTP